MWQATSPFSAIIFDCDGTLSAIEGIDELARQNGVGESVSRLTELAMAKGSMDDALYRQRLNKVFPTRRQVEQLADVYWQHLTPNVQQVIAILQSLGKTVFIVSAGLTLPVTAFGQRLGVPQECVFAVDIQFDERGRYHDFDHQSPLIRATGKCDIIQQICRTHSSTVLIGDGMNDVAAKDQVTRFVGYGGAFFRQHIADSVDFYITIADMLPFLAILLTPQEVALLDETAAALYNQSVALIDSGKVIIK